MSSARPATVNDRVIVVLRNQPAAARPGTRASAMRSAAIANSQAPLLRELRRTHATHIMTYRLVNAFSATVSAAEAANLRSNPDVAEVVPDVLIRGGSPGFALTRPGRSSGSTSGRPGLPGGSPSMHMLPHACSGGGPAMLDPEALQTTETDSTDPSARTARSLGITGAGVKVGFLADGLDPNNVNFIRPNGTSIFDPAHGGDYQDFSGDGLGQLTLGTEAFLDANSIAGQGMQVYNVRRFSAQADPSACDIRIEGVAPGASVVALDVFGTYEVTLQSNFLEAISYAVEVDHVNVLNESFGSYPFPDSAALSVTEQFNDAAIAAGTTVTVASGDSGVTNTIASPASDPKVISVGASTTFRSYAETNYAGARYFASTGWLDDNVSSLSSGGFTQAGNTVSLVAPGDLGFASCSTNVIVYQGCVDMNGNPSPVQINGGTSESAPLTAGAAALVIQAYRLTHWGSSPSPALVKQILTSTATDLGLPATEQGAGLLNTYKAVSLAESVHTSAGAPSPKGESLLLSRGQLNGIGRPGTKKHWQIQVTNTGSRGQLVSAAGRTFSPDQGIQTGSVILEDSSSPKFTDGSALSNNYATFSFTVRPGANRLVASIAYQGPPDGGQNGTVRLILVDPRGRLAADSVPQGVGDAGAVDVRAPVPGVWTGVVSSLTQSYGGTNGLVLWRTATQRFTGFGTVLPSAFFLQPGQSRLVDVTETLPPGAGDVSGSVVIGSNLGGSDPAIDAERDSVPITLRSMVNLTNGGDFGGVLTGGNGRGPSIGQDAYYEFYVGRGHRSITANMTLANDGSNNVGAYLVAPDGQALGFGQNEELFSTGLSLTAYTLNPMPGTWTLVLQFLGPVAGDELSDPFSGSITLDDTKATAPGLPDSPGRLLKRGVTLRFPVRITNTGAAPESYFIDARLDKKATLTLESLDGQTFLLPLQTVPPEWFVPTQATSARVTAQASLPVTFDWGPIQGDPDLPGPPPGKTATGTFAPSSGTIQPGIWEAGPDELGPYPNGGQGGSVTIAMTVVAKQFDPAVSTEAGDLWLASINPLAPFSPVTISPGKSAILYVRIKPTARPGTVVRGTLYVDDNVPALPPYGQATGDELVAIPYAYTVK